MFGSAGTATASCTSRTRTGSSFASTTIRRKGGVARSRTTTERRDEPSSSVGFLMRGVWPPPSASPSFPSSGTWTTGRPRCSTGSAGPAARAARPEASPNISAPPRSLVPGWRKHAGQPFVVSYRDQPESVQDELDKRMYELIGRLFEHGFSAERYDRVADFTTNIAVVPVSAKFGEGVPDLLLTLIGLAQRFLESQLAATEGPAVGTILEVKEEKGLGTTLDTIVYQGTL